MFYYSKSKHRLLPSTNFEELVARCVQIMTSCEIDDPVLAAHGITDQHLLDKGWLQFSSVRVLAHLATDDNEDVVATLLDDALAYHARVVSRMSSYLHLNAANIGRSTWLFGRMLSAEPMAAQEAAVRVAEHLKQTREERSINDKHVVIVDAFVVVLSCGHNQH